MLAKAWLKRMSKVLLEATRLLEEVSSFLVVSRLPLVGFMVIGFRLTVSLGGLVPDG